ncbi:hypothetical protein Shyd_01370 [Streptomyces hydrogenans]|uniref:Uncharacterized protein n=1 Tax=Streptomyces hydrogenans TaxID=1873719 RepID=A0ABQ3P168_9ACTN|nr:hypothetical protein GCM10018784_46800 [Streptomyces hydrogenans]GHI18766.1 hypothetical protein Shyd_01370 [Streptomyces hydrogenans]
MPDPGPAALVLVVRIVHNARLDPSRTVDIAGGHPGQIGAARQHAGKPIKHAGDVIFPSIATSTLRATLDASCSLVSLAVQSLRSM